AVRAANLAATLLIARVFGGAVLGAYTACLAVVTVVIMFADSGLQTSAITELSQGGSGRRNSGAIVPVQDDVDRRGRIASGRDWPVGQRRAVGVGHCGMDYVAHGAAILFAAADVGPE